MARNRWGYDIKHGAIVAWHGHSAGRRGVVRRLMVQDDYSRAYGREALVYEALTLPWQTRRCQESIVQIDELRVIGKAKKVPICAEDRPSGSGRWYPAALDRPGLGVVGKWQREMKIVLRQLAGHVAADARSILEARAVKLDHLLSIYGTLGRPARSR
jgi:hypothetical protein